MMRCGQMMLAEAYLRFFLPAGRCIFVYFWVRILNVIDVDIQIFDGDPISLKTSIGIFLVCLLINVIQRIQFIRSVRRVNVSNVDEFLFLFDHFLVQMGNSEGKSIGQWFGPNTIAQVLRSVKEYWNKKWQNWIWN